MLLDLVFLAIGVALALIGGEFFVRGAVDVARLLRVPPGIIGVTIAAFATSSPETSVAINAAVSGVGAIAIGDDLGSNVVNVALILALALLLSHMPVAFREIRRDLLFAFLTPVLIGLAVMDGQFSRLDGVLLWLAFAFWLGLVIREAMEHRNRISEETIAKVAHPVRSILVGIFGLALLLIAGRLIVDGAEGLALALGLSKFVVGAVVVAVATSSPEMATTLIARIRGHDDLSLGNILGSNIYNGLFIAPLVAVIRPVDIGLTDLGLSLAVGAGIILLVTPLGNGIGRVRGVILLLVYALFVFLTLSGR
ncbi:MAG: calcium/sodium antiporter [Anaerolineae bacterium]|nr:calcium/sodium antiporter [Thermoflexales bacterium]MDW8395476.1 calcium/sodium antiporter [Anaerolineae bacterium]